MKMVHDHDCRLKQLALMECKTVNVAGVNDEPPSGQLMKLFKSVHTKMNWTVIIHVMIFDLCRIQRQ